MIPVNPQVETVASSVELLDQKLPLNLDTDTTHGLRWLREIAIQLAALREQLTKGATP